MSFQNMYLCDFVSVTWKYLSKKKALKKKFWKYKNYAP